MPAVYDLSGKRREIMVLYQQYQNSLSGNPEETIEFDWDDVKLEINGKTRIFSMGLLTTTKGFYHYGKLYQNKKMENFLDIHFKCIEHIGGVHREFVYDNLKQAAKQFY